MGPLSFLGEPGDDGKTRSPKARAHPLTPGVPRGTRSFASLAPSTDANCRVRACGLAAAGPAGPVYGTFQSLPFFWLSHRKHSREPFPEVVGTDLPFAVSLRAEPRPSVTVRTAAFRQQSPTRPLYLLVLGARLAVGVRAARRVQGRFLLGLLSQGVSESS